MERNGCALFTGKREKFRSELTAEKFQGGFGFSITVEIF